MSSLLKQANQSLRSGNYAKAVELYGRILQEQPALGGMIQFNLDLAHKRLLINPAKEAVSLPPHDLSFNWVSHETLQKNSDSTRIVIGGMVLGYPQKDSKAILLRIAECALLYEQIAQLQDLHGLRLITGEELIRPPPSTSKPSAFVHAFGAKDIRLASIWYANSRDLRLAVEKDLPFNQPRVFRAYQYDPVVGGGLVLVGECVLQGDDWTLTDLALVNPYLPVLLTLAKPDGQLMDAALIPYPSLLPGGIHEHECYVGKDANATDSSVLAQELLLEHLRSLDGHSGCALGQIKVDIRESIGCETILSSDFKEWLWSVFSLRISSWNMPELSETLANFWQEIFSTPFLVRNPDKFSVMEKRARYGRTLLCPPRAIPSLRALTASRASGALEQICGRSVFLLVQGNPSAQSFRVYWPDAALKAERILAQDGAIHIPIVLASMDKDGGKEPSYPTGVSAILLGASSNASTAQLIMPIAPDVPVSPENINASPIIDVVISSDAMPPDVFEALLESLSFQTHVEIRRLVVSQSVSIQRKVLEILLHRHFAGRYHIVPSNEKDQYRQRVQRAATFISSSDDGYMLLINQPLVLHDPRTLLTFAQALATPKAVTVSAPLICKVENESKPTATLKFGGVFPYCGLRDSGYSWCEADIVTSIPRTTLPVASHGDMIFMIKTKDWKRSGGFTSLNADDERAAYEFSEKLLSNNKLHLLIPHLTIELHQSANTGIEPYKEWRPLSVEPAHPNAVRIEALAS